MRKINLFLLLTSISITGPAFSDSYLAKSDVKSLFSNSVATRQIDSSSGSNKTVDWQFDKGGKLVVYGNQRGRIATWEVNEKGKLCFDQFSGKKACRFVKKEGEKVTLHNNKGKVKMIFIRIRAQ